MKKCPYGIASWQCAFYVHLGREDLCQDKRRLKLTKEQDGVYTGYGYETCKGYEVDKRFKDTINDSRTL